ncbi:MAG: MBL fold metallo-hydrolase, partial [Steroidobacteraceae bacterium]
MPPASDLARSSLDYLPLEPPAPGEITRVAEGVHWLRSPLPGELDHISLWLLERGAGFALIDTGLASEPARVAWEKLEHSVLAPRPLELIVLTHLHPDHVGLAAWLQGRHDAPVWTSRSTERQLRALLDPPCEEEIAARRAFLRAHGLENAGAFDQTVSGERYRMTVSAMPVVAHHPHDGEEAIWSGARWHWLETGGHAAGHQCLHQPSQGVLIAGDQILPSISPNVSLTSWGEDPDPIDSYLRSLDRLAALDSGTLVLPSHGRPFFGLERRALELREHHARHLDQLRETCREARTAAETLRVLYRRTLSGFHLYLALGEAIA